MEVLQNFKSLFFDVWKKGISGVNISEIIIALLIFLLFFFVNAHAQENTPIEKNDVNNKGMYLSGQLSTNGWGTDIRYILNKTFTLKAGVERLNLTSSMDFSENGIDYVLDLDYRTGGVFVMADINYTRNLYITI